MLNFKIDQFHYSSSTKLFTQESSSLNLSAQYWNSLRHTPVESQIVLENPKTAMTMTFEFYKSDTKDGETYGWNYRSKEGIRLLIIND